jgi:hypothetical protein
MTRLLFVIVFGTFIPFFLSAQQIDDAAQDKLIEKLTQVSLNLAPSDNSRNSIILRLADLHAERGRRLSMKELNEGCTVCKAGNKDRDKAIRLYNDVLPSLENEQKARVNTQIGHLYELTGNESKAIAMYQSLLNEKNQNIVAEAQLSLAEIYFKKRNFDQALKFYKQVMVSHPSQKGLASYRAGWCYFNLGQIDQSVSELKRVLKTPELLSRTQSGIVSVDKQFQEEVSRDLATFLARTPYNSSSLDELYELSPENAKLAHLSYLASEYERLGQLVPAISAWRYSIQRQTEPKARLEGHVHLAQLQAQHQNRKEAVKDYETSLGLWSSLGACADDTCKQLKVRLKQFVLDWNQLEKKSPSPELLEAYQRYLTVFPNEVDMRLWQAQVASQLKDYKLATQEHLTVAQALSQEAKTDPKMEKTRKEWIEVSLLAAIENAELLKDAELIDRSTQAYLDLSIDRKKEMDVRYQRAHIVYEAGQYGPAAEQMKALALDKKASADIRSKAADLALDSLVLMKDDVRLEAWSKELSAALPSQASSFLGVARKSVLTQSSQLASSQDLDKAWMTLNRFDSTGATQEEKNSYLKNKLILAEKLRKLPEAREAADQLLRQPGLSAEDTQFALSRKAWLAELQFDFVTALSATEKIKAKDVDPAGQALKMALLADLAQKDSTPYYRQFVKESKDDDKKTAVVAQIVKSSKQPEKEFEQYKSILAKKPEFFTEVLYEIYAKTGKLSLLSQITTPTQYVVTPYGKAAVRAELLAQYQVQKDKLAKSTIDSANQKKLAQSLKSRVALLEQTEKLAAKAVDQQEWASQIATLSLLAEEHQRFYNEVLSLPVPAGLAPEEEQQYLGLLSEQAAPHQTKANDIKSKLAEIYKNKDAFVKFSEGVQTQVEPMRSVFVKEMQVVKSILPTEMQGLLVEKSTAPVAGSPAIAEVEKLRQSVREQPFDSARVQQLLTYEKQLGRSAMVAYLQGRLETLQTEDTTKVTK